MLNHGMMAAMAISIPTNATIVVPGCAFHVSGFLSPIAADELGAAIVEETYPRWVAQMSYNKGWPARIDKGHTMARFGAPGVSYSYKGKPKPMFEFTASLRRALTSVDGALGTSFNCVVINSYAPTSGLYPHRDSNYIPQLGVNPTIAALSFGTERSFIIHQLNVKGKRIKEGAITVKLGHGDLFVMYGECDTKYHHSIPEEPDTVGTRVSLTFRRHQP